MTRQWGWLSSTLPAFINGYDKPALNAPEQRQQSALTMAEEDDARVRILQSLRGKICKFEWPVNVFHLSQGGKEVGRTSEQREGKPEGRGVLSTVDSVEAEADTSRSAGWCLSSSYPSMLSASNVTN